MAMSMDTGIVVVYTTNYDCFFFFQAEDGIRDVAVTGVQTCALPISVGKGEAVITDTWWQTENGGFLCSTKPALDPMKPGSAGPGMPGIHPVIYDEEGREIQDRKSTRLNSSHGYISYAVFCLKKKNTACIPTLHSRKPPKAQVYII